MKKQFLSVIVITAIATSALAAPVSVLADDYDNKISEQEQKIKNLKEQEASADAKLLALENSIAESQAAADQLQTEQQELKANIAKLQKEITELESRIEKRSENIKDQARAVQLNGSASGYLNAVLTADSFSDAISRVVNVNRMMNANQDMMAQQEKDNNDLKAAQASVSKKYAASQEKGAAIQQKLGAIYESELEVKILKSDLAAQRATEEGTKAKYEKQKNEAVAALARQKQLEKTAQKAAITVTEAAASSSSSNDKTSSENKAAAAPVAEASAEPATSEDSSVNNTATTNPASASSTATNNVASTAASLPVTTTAASPNASGSAVVAEAYRHIGAGYSQAASERLGTASFDCSGLAWYVYKKVTGKDIGGWTVAQEGSGTQIAVSAAQPGDLLFWGGRGATSHVAIYIGGGQYIHAPTYGQTVCVASISSAFMPSFAVRVS